MKDLRLKCAAIQWIAGEESGQGLVEYALILILIAVVVSAGLEKVGPMVAGDFDKAKDAFH